MSGWDEGAVTYSDQAQFPRGGDPDKNKDSPHAALGKFKAFIRGFHGSKGDFHYRESLVHNQDNLTVALEDLYSFDPDLSQKLRESPREYLPLFESAVSEVLTSIRSKVAGDNGMEEPLTGGVQI